MGHILMSSLTGCFETPKVEQQAARDLSHEVEAADGARRRNVVVAEEANIAMKWLRLKQLVYLDALGKRRVWESVERMTRRGGLDAVAVVALMRSDAASGNGISIVVIRQYRPALDRLCLELPAGLIDEGETALEAAARELREETGFLGVAQSDEGLLSPVLGCEPGLSNATMQMVLLDVYERVPAQPEDGEHIEVMLLPARSLANDLRAMVDKENIAVDARLFALAAGIELGAQLQRIGSSDDKPMCASCTGKQLLPAAWRLRCKYACAATYNVLTSRHVYLSATFMVLMCIANILEEFLYTGLRGFDFYWSLAGLELLVFASASLWRALSSQPDRHIFNQPRAPVFLYAVTGASMALSQSLGKVANKYVNFTVSTIFKCAKVVPTMSLGVICLSRRYSAQEVVSALSMSISATFFALGAAEVDVSFNTLGVLYNTLYLVFQSCQVILQDYALNDYAASVNESMLYANFFGFVVIFVVVIGTGELAAAALFFSHRGPRAIALVLIRTLLFYFAVCSYSTIIKESGGVAAVLVGIFRKIATVILSSVIYPKRYSHSYPVGAFFLVISLACELRIGIKKANSKARQNKLGAESVSQISNDEVAISASGTKDLGSPRQKIGHNLDGAEKGVSTMT